MKQMLTFFKNEIVLTISFVLASASAFFVKPDLLYLQYIDYRTLSILLSLMLTMAGFQRLQVFRQIGEIFVSKTSSVRSIVFVLIALNFFFSMLITNDVALLTFVPFSVITLSLVKRKDLFCIVIVLETIAANLGSMLTPLGNPQNLYLYSLADMSLISFVQLMLPYSAVSFVLLILFNYFFIKAEKVLFERTARSNYKRTKKEKGLLAIYLLTFLLSLLTVMKVIFYPIGLVCVLLLVMIFDRKVLRKPDYSLLATFVFLFIFIGNIKRIPAIASVIDMAIQGHELLVAVLLSQVISNVPAAILCSGFTDEISKLIIGTNLGGLGTLIASMASLISFKQYSYTENADKKRYLLVFTGLNLLFLAILLLLTKLF